MPKTSLCLIRHGDYLHLAGARDEARADGGLSQRGRRQALALRDRLLRDDPTWAPVLYCSTLPRARETAELIAPAWGLEPLPTDALREWESGNEALGVEAFQRAFDAIPGQARRRHRFHPAAETIEEFALRVQGFLASAVREHAGRSIVIVAHGGVIEATFAWCLGFGRGPFEGGYPAAGHTSLTFWQRDGREGEWVQVFANDMHHLGPQHE